MGRTNKNRKISSRQEAFTQLYIVSGNQAQSYLEAYPNVRSKNAAKSAASRLLTNVNVSARIAELTHKSSIKAQVSQELVLKNLLNISNRCLQIVAVMTKDGRKTVQATDEFICSKCDEVHTVGLFKFDAAGANKANELLGRYMAMFTDKIEHSGGLTFEDYMIQRKKRKLAAAKSGEG